MAMTEELEQAGDLPAVLNQASGSGWTLYNADCVEVVGSLPTESIGFTVFSPPFASLYTYSNSDRDMGNSKSHDEFTTHFRFLIGELLRATKPGRLCSVHCMQLPRSKTRDGYIGIRDFRGEIVRAFEEVGWINHSEVCIWKDPVTAMQRTKAIGLLHKQVVKDSCMSRQGIADYVLNFCNGNPDPSLPGNLASQVHFLINELLSILPSSVTTFRKPGVNAEPVAGELDHFAGDPTMFRSEGRLSIDIWQRYASPVWMDIDPSNTLQYMAARDEKDERHICPLQLDVIERCLQLWSNPGDVVLSPFAGIASEGYMAVKLGRRFIGAELKESYWNVGRKNLMAAEEAAKEGKLFT